MQNGRFLQRRSAGVRNRGAGHACHERVLAHLDIALRRSRRSIQASRSGRVFRCLDARGAILGRIRRSWRVAAGLPPPTCFVGWFCTRNASLPACPLCPSLVLHSRLNVVHDFLGDVRVRPPCEPTDCGDAQEYGRRKHRKKRKNMQKRLGLLAHLGISDTLCARFCIVVMMVALVIIGETATNALARPGRRVAVNVDVGVLLSSFSF